MTTLTSKAECPKCGDSLMFKLKEPGSMEYTRIQCLSNYLGESCDYVEEVGENES